jgi:cell division protein FtsB
MALLPPLPTRYKGWIVVCGVGVILFLLSAIFGERGLVHLVRLQNEQRELEQTTFALQQRNDQMRRRIDRLQTDDRYVERLARERLGLVKQGEVIYRVGGEPK